MQWSFVSRAIVVAALLSGTAVEAAGGCGVGWHRGPHGGCRRNVVVVAPAKPAVVAVPVAPVVVAQPGAVIYAPVGKPCPVGYHLGPRGRRCWPN